MKCTPVNNGNCPVEVEAIATAEERTLGYVWAGRAAALPAGDVGLVAAVKEDPPHNRLISAEGHGEACEHAMLGQASVPMDGDIAASGELPPGNGRAEYAVADAHVLCVQLDPGTDACGKPLVHQDMLQVDAIAPHPEPHDLASFPRLSLTITDQPDRVLAAANDYKVAWNIDVGSFCKPDLHARLDGQRRPLGEPCRSGNDDRALGARPDRILGDDSMDVLQSFP